MLHPITLSLGMAAAVASLISGTATGPMPTTGQHRQEAAADDDCKCYANGTSYDIGGQACLGGFTAVCAARDGDANCGWDYPTDSDGNKIRCE